MGDRFNTIKTGQGDLLSVEYNGKPMGTVALRHIQQIEPPNRRVGMLHGSTQDRGFFAIAVHGPGGPIPVIVDDDEGDDKDMALRKATMMYHALIGLWADALRAAGDAQ